MRLTGIRGKKGGYKLPFISIEWWLPPRSLRLALRGARPPAVLSGRRFGSVGCGARRLRGPQRLRALPSPPRHFKWGRGCGAARDGGNEGFRRLRAAGVWDYIQL